MNDLGIESAIVLWDFYLISTVLLTFIYIVNKLISQPAHRMAMHWANALGLLILALLCTIPNWSMVHMTSVVPEQDWSINIEPTFKPAVQINTLSADIQLKSTSTHASSETTTEAISSRVHNSTLFFGENLETYSLIFIVAGSVISLIWLTVGLWQVRKIRYNAKPADLKIHSLLKNLCSNNEQVPHIAISPKLTVAVAVGLYRPIILLPQYFTESATRDELKTVLVHELTHIRHKDLWLLSLLRGLLTILWCHPLYWLWRHQVRLDQEALADAAAADVASRSDYAEQLVYWAKTAIKPKPTKLATSVGLWESPSQLRQRVAMLLDDKLTIMRSASRRWRVGSVLLLACSSIALSLFTLQPKLLAEADKSDKSKIKKSYKVSDPIFQVREVHQLTSSINLDRIPDELDVEIMEWSPQKGTTEKILLQKGRALLTEKDVLQAIALPSTQDALRYDIDVELTPDAEDRFALATKNLIGKQIALLSDGRILIAPKLHSAIYGKLRISGNFNKEEAESIANIINPKTRTKEKDLRNEKEKLLDSISTEKKYDALSRLRKRIQEINKQLYEQRKPNTISGICLDLEGQPLSAVEITVYGKPLVQSKLSRLQHKTKSGTDGKFLIEDLVDITKTFPDGIPEQHFQGHNPLVYSVTGRLKGYTPGIGSHLASEIARSGNTNIWIMQRSQELRGRITNQQGEPVANAKVTAGLGNLMQLPGINQAVTNANGEYLIDDLPAYSYDEEKKMLEEMQKKEPLYLSTRAAGREPSQVLYVNHPNYAVKRSTIETIPGKVDVELSAGSILQGIVTLPNGERAQVPGGIVRLQRVMPRAESDSEWNVSLNSFQTESASLDNGGYGFESLPAGKYHLRAYVEGWTTAGIENVEVAEGEVVRAPDIKLTKGGRVKVQLVDHETNEPLRFDKPTKGYINPNHRPPRAAIFIFRNNIVEFSTEGKTEIQITPGYYVFHAYVPKKDGKKNLTGVTYDGIASPDDINKVPAQEIKEGEILELEIKMRSENATAQSVTGTLTVAATVPSIVDGNNQDQSAEDNWKERLNEIRKHIEENNDEVAIRLCKSLLTDNSFTISANRLEVAIVLNNFAYVLATSSRADLRDGHRAMELARKSLEAFEEPNFDALETLAAAQAETGDFEQAIKTMEESLDYAYPTQRELVKKTIEQYKANKPKRRQSSQIIFKPVVPVAE